MRYVKLVRLDAPSVEHHLDDARHARDVKVPGSSLLNVHSRHQGHGRADRLAHGGGPDVPCVDDEAEEAVYHDDPRDAHQHDAELLRLVRLETLQAGEPPRRRLGGGVALQRVVLLLGPALACGIRPVWMGRLDAGGSGG